MFFHQAADAFPMMDAARYKELLADIEANGQREEITICDGRVLDGRNRYNACAELGIKPKTRDYDGDPWAYAWSLNGNRRDLPEAQRAAIKMKIDRSREEWIAEQEARAKVIQDEANRKRAEAAKERERNENGTLAPKPVCVPKEHALDKPEPPKPYQERPGRAARAAAANVSTGTQAKVEWIANKRPDLLDKVATGEIKATDAIREMKREEIVEKLESVVAMEAKVLEGVYDVIVIDPPWPMEKIERDERQNQVEFDYPTMQEAELAELPLPMSDDCHVLLWTTHKFLPMAFRLAGKWGLKYVCMFTWHKPGGFQPFGLPQYNCEFALYCRKGTPSFVDTKAFPVCFNAPRGKHSEKPEEFYDTIRRVTAGRRLDMFNRREIPGFDGWGKEAK